MNSDEMTSASYLQELYNTTQGNLEVTVSMHDIGLAIGIEKSEAGRIAEDLMVTGYIELKTLAGGISITNEGLSSLGITPQPDKNEAALQLSAGTNITDEDRQVIDTILNNVKNVLPGQNREYHAIEQAVLDIKVIELHLLSPSPKTAVILALFRSLAQSFEKDTAILNDSGLATVIGVTQSTPFIAVIVKAVPMVPPTVPSPLFVPPVTIIVAPVFSVKSTV